MRIGLLEDDTDLIDIISLWFADTGDQVQAYTTGESFRKGVLAEQFDVLVLDWHLPDTTGIVELKWLRGEIGSKVPVIFNTCREDEESVVEALDNGADDYLVKPVSKEVVIARIKALHRRHRYALVAANKIVELDSDPAQMDGIEDYSPYQINYAQRMISVDSKKIKLTNKEFELAAFMFKNASSLVSRDYLLDTIWGMRADLNTRTVDTHISRIRTKLGLSADVGWQLASIYQRGYRLYRVEVE